MSDIIIRYSIFFIIYIIPIMIFIYYSLGVNLHKGLIILISGVYIVLSVFTSKETYNLFPFLIVIFDIILIKKVNKNSFISKGFNIFNALKYASLSYAFSLIVSFMYLIILMSLNFKIKDQQVINEMLNLPMNRFIIMIPIIVIFAPIVEEFVFRWFLYDRVFKKNIGIYWGAILSSSLFALAHFNLKSFAVIMTLGFINCWLLNHKGYWYAVFNHGFFNSISVIMLLLNKLT